MKPKLKIDATQTPGYEKLNAKLTKIKEEENALNTIRRQLEKELDEKISAHILASAKSHYGYEKDKIYYAVPATSGKIIKVLFKDYQVKWKTDVRFIVAVIKGNNISHMQELDHSLWSLEEDTKFDVKSNSK